MNFFLNAIGFFLVVTTVLLFIIAGAATWYVVKNPQVWREDFQARQAASRKKRE